MPRRFRRDGPRSHSDSRGHCRLWRASGPEPLGNAFDEGTPDPRRSGASRSPVQDGAGWISASWRAFGNTYVWRRCTRAGISPLAPRRGGIRGARGVASLVRSFRMFSARSDRGGRSEPAATTGRLTGRTGVFFNTGSSAPTVARGEPCQPPIAKAQLHRKVQSPGGRASTAGPSAQDSLKPRGPWC